MLGKIVLWVSAIAFIGYGIACLLSPELPANNAGITIASGDGLAEIGAMYGGLQTSFGVLCLLGALRADLYRPVLLMLVLVIGSLATARLAWMVIGTDPVGFYSWGAMIYEFLTAILAGVALRRAPATSTA